MLSEIDYDHRHGWMLVMTFDGFLARVEAFNGDVLRLAAEFIDQNRKEFEHTESEKDYIATTAKFLRDIADMKDSGTETTPSHIEKFK